MTDVPRRSFPLVVPPPGGFEEAVRHGRRIRRRRAGSSTGAALVLVGALAYSTINGPGGTSGLEPATRDVPRTEATAGPNDESPTPEPTVSPTDTTTTSSPAPGNGEPYVPPAGVPDPLISVPPQHTPPGGPAGRAFAPRSPITEGMPSRGTATECLEEATEPWCAYARVTPPEETGTTWRLAYTLCRSVDRARGDVAFDRKQEVEFVAVDLNDAGNPNDDETYWTYSRGQAIVSSTEVTQVGAGWCVEWHTWWTGYDDYGLNDPQGGQYLLKAVSTGTADFPLPQAEIEFVLS